MNAPHPHLKRCHSFVVCHLSDAKTQEPQPICPSPFVTISRQTGAGAQTLGMHLQPLLDEVFPTGDKGWTLFNRNLVQTAMREHGLPERFARYLPEDHISEIGSLIGELLGLHPPIYELNKDVFETLVNLASLGGVILVGRGSHVVTRKLEHGFHLRLVGGLESRIRRVEDYYQMGRQEAVKFIKREDKARSVWVRENFDEDVNDPSRYDLSINTDRNSLEDSAVMIVDALKRRFPRSVQASAERSMSK